MPIYWIELFLTECGLTLIFSRGGREYFSGRRMSWFTFDRADMARSVCRNANYFLNCKRRHKYNKSWRGGSVLLAAGPSPVANKISNVSVVQGTTTTCSGLNRRLITFVRIQITAATNRPASPLLEFYSEQLIHFSFPSIGCRWKKNPVKLTIILHSSAFLLVGPPFVCLEEPGFFTWLRLFWETKMFWQKVKRFSGNRIKAC